VNALEPKMEELRMEDEYRDEHKEDVILNPDGSDHKFEAELAKVLSEEHPELD
jgi:hypothetical protein